MTPANIETKAVTPDIIHGFVIDFKTNDPVLWVKVNVIDSDETALTNDNGEFRIISWKSFPVTLKFEHENFEPILLKVTYASKDLVIMLKSKY
jgi:hypothetical protein